MAKLFFILSLFSVSLCFAQNYCNPHVQDSLQYQRSIRVLFNQRHPIAEIMADWRQKDAVCKQIRIIPEGVRIAHYLMQNAYNEQDIIAAIGKPDGYVMKISGKCLRYYLGESAYIAKKCKCDCNCVNRNKSIAYYIDIKINYFSHKVIAIYYSEAVDLYLHT